MGKASSTRKSVKESLLIPNISEIMLQPFEEPASDLSGILGKHIIYTYSNGWEYEMYYKNSDTVDYKVRSGSVGGRVVKGQKVSIRQLQTALPSEKVEASESEMSSYMISWVEPTGTSVVQVLNLNRREVRTVILFPDWVVKETVCFQNEHLDLMRSYRDQGPTYPIHPKIMLGRLHFIEHCTLDNEHVINSH
ncbi:hypothetical protein KP509_11G023300 [Ceratopteris richardii]|uniref:Phenolic acid decarboxylase n=2 Tax=Ceratopteris richardii TaxID=49495 RepID=A0A8T2TR51_CERRI|nr:hypothetical protein KP509_11G023200 [Ceratopteris richardii]KAH7424771.1 hypothetical protein KP509_11G023300 [Ceratopteris richardii]KAH7424772.1 hypothetical protein KP509_11G023300 [Ceratopteris richardii]KAH7424776.1 hypothetical protein KP509_11G023300 [Ceratopteris richardii]